MIGETAWVRTKTTNIPVVLKVYGIEGLTKESIDMDIGHERSVGVCFANILAFFA